MEAKHKNAHTKRTPHRVLDRWGGMSGRHRLSAQVAHMQSALISLAPSGYTGMGAPYHMRLKTRVPLVPPKPKLFFSATSIFMSRAVLAQ